MRNVDFFVVGAAKSGTTALYQTLKSADAIGLPKVKEPNHFNTGSSNVPGKGPGDNYATEAIRDPSVYQKNFVTHDSTLKFFDFSVSYLYDDQAASNIFKYNPQAKIIIILRNPIDRAWSHHLHLTRDCRETLSFEDAIEAEQDRMEQQFEFSWHYLEMGLYSQQVKRYLDVFGENAVLILDFKDVVGENCNTLSRLAEFVGVPAIADLSFKQDGFNATGQVKNKFVANILNRPSFLRNIVKKMVPRELGTTIMNRVRNKNLQSEKPVMTDSTRQLLKDYYKEDIQKLSEIVNLDFSNWE
jgi:hypothetical protein